jgi:hypothetical protein
MTKRTKRKTAEQIAAELLARRRQDFEAVNMDPDATTLPAYADVQIERQGRKSDRNRAWRSNVFRLLLERKSITTNHYEAAYQLIGAWAAWKGLDGKGETFGEIVDGSNGSAELVTDRMIRAGREVARALNSLSREARTIVEHMMFATVEEDRAMHWRGILERAGFRGSLEKQTTIFVCALEELRQYYEAPKARVA